jgi:hypothetical protein
VLELWDGTRASSQARVQNEINLHNQGKRVVNAKWNVSGVMNLIKVTTLNISFTQPTSFGKKHHCPPCNILYYFPW